MKFTYYLFFSFGYLLSLFPLRVLYVLADALYLLLYHCVRYRRQIVRKNLSGSFPEKDAAEILRIEKDFYRFFCDYLVENIKLFSISRKEMMRRMTFSGVDEVVEQMTKTDKMFCFMYLGHYCNWEWIASMAYWTPPELLCAQIYHPLYNKAFDKLFLRLRSQYGGECIPMKETLRRIISLKRSKQKTIIGFISDQAPKWNSIHHWCRFMHRETPVFIGAEQIGKQVGAVFYFAEVRRIRRGYYHCELKPMSVPADTDSEYVLTDCYMQMLEEMIRRNPAFWLWSHNRWKRTKEEWIRRNEKAASV